MNHGVVYTPKSHVERSDEFLVATLARPIYLDPYYSSSPLALNTKQILPTETRSPRRFDRLSIVFVTTYNVLPRPCPFSRGREVPLARTRDEVKRKRNICPQTPGPFVMGVSALDKGPDYCTRVEFGGAVRDYFASVSCVLQPFSPECRHNRR